MKKDEILSIFKILFWVIILNFISIIFITVLLIQWNKNLIVWNIPLIMFGISYLLLIICDLLLFIKCRNELKIYSFGKKEFVFIIFPVVYIYCLYLIIWISKKINK